MHVSKVLQSKEHIVLSNEVLLIERLHSRKRTEHIGIRNGIKLSAKVHTNLRNKSRQRSASVTLLHIIERHATCILNLLHAGSLCHNQYLIEAIVEFFMSLLILALPLVGTPNRPDEQEEQYNHSDYAP